jgi:hypothetical protein
MLLGRVVDEKGEPIPHATIAVKQKGSHGYMRHDARRSEIIESDDGGEFSIEVQQGQEYRISASKSSYLSSSVEVTGGKCETLSQGVITVTLKHGVTLQGFVREGGAPVAGIIVRPTQREKESQAVTDVDGSFTLEGLPLGVVGVEFLYKREGGNEDDFSSLVATKMVNTRDTRTVDIELPATGGVRFDLKNAPDEYTLFLASPKQGIRYGFNKKKGENIPPIFEHVIPGDYLCMVFVRDKKGFRELIKRVVTVKAHEVIDYSFDMDKEASENSITGSVYVGDTLLTSGIITLLPPLDSSINREEVSQIMMAQGCSASINSEGVFEVAGVEPGRYQYVVFNATIGSSSHQHFTGEVELRENQREVALVVKGVKISGVVKDEELLTPIFKARISLVPAGDTDSFLYIDSYGVQSDERGQFIFYGIPVGEYSMTVQHAEKGTSSRRVRIEGDRSDIYIALGSGVHLTGLVLSRAGAPIVNAMLLLCNAQGALDQVDAGDEGDFSFSHALTRGRYTLYAFAPGHALSALALTVDEDHTQEVRLVPGGGAHITLSSRSGSVAGLQLTICDDIGRPVSRVMGAVSPWLRSSFSIPRTTTKGECCVEGLAPGTYTVGIEGRDVTEKMTITALETTELTIPID